MQSNRITKIEGLEELENLEQLYLSHNGVERLEGLEKNVSRFSFNSRRDLALIGCALQVKLTTLDVGNNFIPAIENISHLTQLEELWVRDFPSPYQIAIPFV